MKRHQASFIGARFLGAIGICVQLAEFGFEDVENFSSAVNAINHELGCSGPFYRSSSPFIFA